MSVIGNLGEPSPEFLARLKATAPKAAPKDEDGIDDADDATETGKD